MAQRVVKTGGSSIEFAPSPQPWQASDLDADLDQIFTNITNPNIANGAAIATAKLAQDGGIVTGMLGAGAVTTPKIANAAITNPLIAAAAVGPSQLALGATNRAYGAAALTPGLIIPAATVTALHPAIGPLTFSGGKVLVSVAATLSVTNFLMASGAQYVTIQWQSSLGVLLTEQVALNLQGVPTATWPFAIGTRLLTNIGAGSQTIQIVIYISSGSMSVFATNPGYVTVLELS